MKFGGRDVAAGVHNSKCGVRGCLALKSDGQ